jgi:hypothetical protein
MAVLMVAFLIAGIGCGGGGGSSGGGYSWNPERELHGDGYRNQRSSPQPNHLHADRQVAKRAGSPGPAFHASASAPSIQWGSV